MLTMKHVYVFALCVSLAAQSAVAFPRIQPRQLVDNTLSDAVGLVKEIVQAGGSSSKDPNATTPFDASKQLVDTTGAHAVSIFLKFRPILSE